MSKDRSIYIDDFARKQASPTRQGYEEYRQVDSQPKFKVMEKPVRETGVPELDRLVKERKELIETGVYGKEDLLIRELDRQIEALSQS